MRLNKKLEARSTEFKSYKIEETLELFLARKNEVNEIEEKFKKIKQFAIFNTKHRTKMYSDLLSELLIDFARR